MKRISLIHFGSNKRQRQTNKDDKDNKNKVNKNNCDDNSDDEYGNEYGNIYLKDNHLYYHDDVNSKNIDKVKKLMREYMEKCSKHKYINYISNCSYKPLYLHIYSYGGEVHSCLTLYDFIIEYSEKIPVYTVVEGVAASAATIISIAGTKRYITPNSYMLIHQISTFFGGNFEQIKDEFGNCEKIMKQLKDIYSQKTNLKKTQLTDILKRDVNWNANECKKYGLVDEIKLIDIFND